MQNEINITKQDILDRLHPLQCAYNTGETVDLIYVPQDEEELKFVIEQINYCAFRPIDRQSAYNLGYKELAKWSDDNDYLFISEDNWFILDMPKVLFKQ